MEKGFPTDRKSRSPAAPVTLIPFSLTREALGYGVHLWRCRSWYSLVLSNWRGVATRSQDVGFAMKMFELFVLSSGAFVFVVLKSLSSSLVFVVRW